MGARVLSLPQNDKGRDFVVGDVHGCFDLLDKALAAVSFDPSCDRLICVGDLINRGARSPDVLRYLAQPWFFSVRGNHETMFMHMHKSGKLDNPGPLTRVPKGFGWILEESAETRARLYAAFKQLPIAIEVATPEGPVGFVHANVPDGMAWDEFKRKLSRDDHDAMQTAVWSRKRIDAQDAGGVGGALRVFFGHTTVDGGPKSLGNCFFIDTGAAFKLLEERNQEDLFLTIADIKANAADICAPAPTQDPLVRTALRRNGGPKV